MLPLAVALLGATLLSAQQKGYYRHPTIHGDRIVFSSEGDLWRVGLGGGLATRITSDAGMETHPQFAPSGRSIAFSASYDGNQDVYVMPATGGVARRLTWHPGGDEVLGWTPDGRNVVFRSRRQSTFRDYRVFLVPAEGGQPRKLDLGSMSLCSISPDGKRIAFNRFSQENATWKRYYGGTSQDVWIGGLEPGSKFAQVTDWAGADRFPMWRGDRLVFLSDRSGTLNLHSMNVDGGAVEQHTTHSTYDARWPDLHGDRAVYMHAGGLRVFDFSNGSDEAIDVSLPSDRVRVRPRSADASKTLESYALSDDGSHMTLAARGEIWLRPVAEGRTVELARTAAARERAPALSPDGQFVAYVSDASGEQQLCVRSSDGGGEARVLTPDRAGWMNQPIWSPDGKHLAWSDLSQALFVLELATGSTREVGRSMAGEIQNYTFSPDSAWLAFAAVGDNFFSSIHLHRLETAKTTRVTTPFTNDNSPTWSPDGRYLFFLSDRHINPTLGQRDLQHIVTKTLKPCALILQADGHSPFLADEIIDRLKSVADGEKGQESEPSHRIDLTGIEHRVVEFPLPGANYGQLTAAGNGRLLYSTEPTPGLLDMVLFASDPTPRRTLHAFDLKSKKPSVVIDKLRDWTLSGDGKTLAWRVGPTIHVAPAAGKPSAATAKAVQPSQLPLRVVPADEWRQIFHEAWRLQRDFFWAENLANVDWESVRDRFEPLLPRVGSRDELNDLIGQMLGELGTSHAYVMGGDIARGATVRGGLLGADLERDDSTGLLRFTRILQPEPWETDLVSPLRMSHVDVREGDYLFAIDGRAIDRIDNLHAELTGRAGRHVLLTVGRSPDRDASRDVQLVTLNEDRGLRYADWCRRNREHVEKASKGRLGYFHMPDMMGAGLKQFVKGFYPQIHKEGLIIDARYNGGGFVSQMVIERLTRRPIAYQRPRRGAMSTNPFRTHIGHKVALTNQLAGSDGDIFPRSFQLRGLGPVIGMRTWGGVVGISPGRSHVDGGMTTQPTSAWWEPSQGYGLENGGVEPDIRVDIRPEDWAADRDPQLDRGIRELLERLESEPVRLPEPPPIPDKSKRAARRG